MFKDVCYNEDKVATETEIFTVEEVKKSLKCMKNNK